MLYNISNPSDPYTIEVADHQVAAFACFVLGEGQYGFEALDGSTERNVPIFLFGGSEAWCRKTFGMSLEAMANDVMANKKDQLIAALDSVLLGDAEERDRFKLAAALTATPEELAAVRKAHDDRHRSSLNAIGKRAWAIADSLRKR